MVTCRGSKDRPGRGLGRRIQAIRLTAGDDSADGGVAVGDPLKYQWDGIRSVGMKEFPIPALRNQST